LAAQQCVLSPLDAIWPENFIEAQPEMDRALLRLTLALYQPDIPQNCGTMLRLCACMGLGAAIIEPTGFPASDRAFRRAGLDYLDHVEIARHPSFAAFLSWRKAEGRRLILLSTKAAEDYCDFRYAPGDILLVGRESAGVPDEVRRAADASVRIPMRPPLRSLNVAVAAAMVLGEAIRQMRVRERIGL
jgi:tRNA (cytidine/uridine-2'-O-)-methyltransferase